MRDKLSFVKARCCAYFSYSFMSWEMIMSVCTSEMMTNHHRVPGFHPLEAVMAMVRLWRQRAQRRHELLQLGERDFHDVGASWSDFAHEASKPFWRS